MGPDMRARKSIYAEVAVRYRKAGKKEKGRILDEYALLLGRSRTYLAHVLSGGGKPAAAGGKRRKGGGRKPVYAGESVAVLRRIWAFFWYRCGKILAPFMRENMRFLEGHFGITPEVGELLLRVSPATIDRVLKADRKRLEPRRKGGTKPGKLLKSQVPVRVYYADAEKKPGFFETDTVHHCGGSEAGEYCLTLTATDVYSGWVELRPVLNKAHAWAFEALRDIKTALPFPMRGLDSDNGGEFINSAPVKWCREERVQFTRTRPYRKNDNCYVEQKNGACVRNHVGYGHFSSEAQRDALAAVYRSLCPLLNFFMPTMRLVSRTKVGLAVRKVYDKNVVSPYRRLMDSPDLGEGAKAELARRFAVLDPVVLQTEVHRAVGVLTGLG